MLIDMQPIVDLIRSNDDPQRAVLAQVLGASWTQVEPGIIEGDLNLGNELSHIVLTLPEHGQQPLLRGRYTTKVRFGKSEIDSTNDGQFFDLPPARDGSYRSTYAVADDLDQVKAYFGPEIEAEDRVYVIGFVYFHRNLENKGKGGGWRWHKWGPYIGTFESQCEYLDDEEGIDKVLVCHLYELNPLLLVPLLLEG